MDILTSPLGTPLKELLTKANIVTFDQLKGLKVADLARQSQENYNAVLKLLPAECATYKREIDLAAGWLTSTSTTSTAQTALQLIDDRRPSSIVTFCKDLDTLLGGGVQLGDLTEICGIPGIGKTQLCMQLALNVQIPIELGGVEGEAVYVDTEGSFMAARAEQMAAALSRHLKNLHTRRHVGDDVLGEKLATNATVDGLLERIHVYRCTDLAEQTAVIMGLDAFIATHPNVRLIIIDSFAFHYRYLETDMAARSRHLQQMSQALHRVAVERRTAVLVVNQMTTRIDASSKLDGALPDGTLCAAVSETALDAYASSGKLIPALGDVWAHACTHRLLLGFGVKESDDPPQRLAQLVKSATNPPGLIAFTVTNDGIRGCPAVKQATGSSQIIASPGVVSPPVAGTKRKAHDMAS